MSRLVLDNDQNLDANNIYLPETENNSSSFATNGQITIDSVNISNGTQSSVTLDFTILTNTSYPFTNFLDVLIGTSIVASLNLNTYNNATELATAIGNLTIAGYTLTSSGSTVTVTRNSTGNFTEQFSVSIPSIPQKIKAGYFSGGSDPSVLQMSFSGINPPLVTLTAPSDIDINDTSQSVANKIKDALNQLSDFSPNGVTVSNSTLHFSTTVGTSVYNDKLPVINVINSGSIVTSNPVAMTGGNSGILSLTPSLAPINKSRKSYFLNDTLFLRGFCGFSGLHTVPSDITLQSNFFSIDENKCVIDSENGIGFEHKLANIADGTYYLAVALRLNSSNNVSDTLSEHLAFKISCSGNNILVSLVEITGKTVSDGWVLSNDVPIIESSDSFVYSQNDSISFIYPNQNPSAIQFLMKDNLGLVKQAITLTNGSKFDAIVSKVSNNTFALFHIFANSGANADITVIKSLSK